MKTLKRVAMAVLLLLLVVPASQALLVFLAMTFVAQGRKGVVEAAFMWADEIGSFVTTIIAYIKDPD